MTTQPTPTDHPLATQTLSLLESLIDDLARRAIDRHAPAPSNVPLWIDAKQTAELLGAGYTPRRVKELGHIKKIVMDRREPGVSNSPWIFERQSVLAYSARRVWQLEQGAA